MTLMEEDVSEEEIPWEYEELLCQYARHCEIDRHSRRMLFVETCLLVLVQSGLVASPETVVAVAGVAGAVAATKQFTFYDQPSPHADYACHQLEVVKKESLRQAAQWLRRLNRRRVWWLVQVPTRSLDECVHELFGLVDRYFPPLPLEELKAEVRARFAHYDATRPRMRPMNAPGGEPICGDSEEDEFT